MSQQFSSSSGSPFTIPDGSSVNLNKLSKGKQGPDYIPYNKGGRDSYGRLSFNTGVFWLSGFIVGGGIGLYEGYKGASSPNYKIRFNSVMNGFSKRGSAYGNTLGIIAFLYTASGLALDMVPFEPIRENQFATPILSGAMTGLIYKSTRGVRAASLAACVGAAASCVYSFGSSYINDHVLMRGGRF